MPKGLSTRSVHQAGHKDKLSKAIAFPIYQTSTFGQSTPGHPTEYLGRKLSYGRSENPTRTVLEETLAEIENAKFGLTFATGLAAVTAIVSTLKAGDRIVACSDLYGGAYRLFTQVFAKFGLEFVFVETSDLGQLERALSKPTQILWLETPSNPLLNITDIQGAANLAKQIGATVVVDNTFATPVLQHPLELGADIVLHSTTKYLNGHGDVVNGALLTNSEKIWNELKYVQNAAGLVPGPQDCYLVLRGLKTLELRMERHCQNARAIASWLESHPKVSRVYYPGLKSHPGHDIAKNQMSDFGAMMSIEVVGGLDNAIKFMESVELFTLAESLGCVMSLVNHPASMTHASVPKDVRESVGITDGLIRISIGIEDEADLIADLDQALSKL